jgi:hypothetical protein
VEGRSAEVRTRQAERRNLVSSAFIGLLAALAVGEAVVPVRDSFRDAGLTLATSMLFLAFFFTLMRFFIGALLHLLGPELAAMSGRVWFHDFMWITVETVVLVFLGGLTSLEASSRSSVGFVRLLLVLFAIDIAWVAAQWVLSRVFPSFRRGWIPWKWAALNAVAGAALLIPRLWSDGFYGDGLLVWLGVTSLAAFVVDVVLVDYYDLI